MSTERCRVDVVLALPTETLRVRLELAPGSCVEDAVRLSKLDAHPQAPAQLDGHVGRWGQVCGLDAAVEEGDRIELYRDLTVDPMIARRRRAAHRQRQEDKQKRSIGTASSSE
ncbi:MAG: RnfH family protein [Xanthomonadales bacterium]|nr:RnfH family protein [Xanthomonadales bacterium]MCB1643618.1 RnfH family protein [Xanthomonadales bacterium]